MSLSRAVPKDVSVFPPSNKMLRLSWRKRHKILKNDEFKSIFIKGKRLSGPTLKLYLLAGDPAKTVFGITLSKKIKGSVLRNRYKRILREILRKTHYRVKPGWKIIVNVMMPYSKIEYDFIQDEILGLLKNAKVLLSNE